MFDIFYIGEKDAQFCKLKEKFFTIKQVDNFFDAKLQAITKFFWCVWADVLVKDDFDFDYVPDSGSQNIPHVFLNGQYADGIWLIPKKNVVREKEIEHRFLVHKKEVDIVASIPKSYDKFMIDTFDDYGFLSNRSEEEQISGTRIKPSEIKKNQKDFVLWKPSTGDTPGWDSPWGFGRPGWHLECSAMAKKYLGKTLDIHGGGSDLLFPHHENECAQSMCSHSGKPLANYWIHNGMIDFDNVKMSKSEGNLLLIRDLLKQIGPEVIRMAFLTTHYRKPINWNDALITDSEKKLDRLYGSIRKLGKVSPAEPTEEMINALADDINTPKALSELFAIAKRVNNAKSENESKQLASTLVGSANLLGLMNEDAEKWFENIDVDEKLIDRLLNEREAARSDKDFEKADQIRQEIESLGVSIEDGPDGPIWKKQ